MAESWQEQARCREPSNWPVLMATFDAAESDPVMGEAKSICRGCFVWKACLLAALAHDERQGVWGGLTGRERRRAVRRANRRRLLSGGGQRIVVRESAAGGRGSGQAKAG
jgi:hypothetical protein